MNEHAKDIKETIEAAVLLERARCTAIINSAREGEIDADLRSIRHRIQSGKPFPEVDRETEQA